MTQRTALSGQNLCSAGSEDSRAPPLSETKTAVLSRYLFFPESLLTALFQAKESIILSMKVDQGTCWFFICFLLSKIHPFHDEPDNTEDWHLPNGYEAAPPSVPGYQ